MLRVSQRLGGEAPLHYNGGLPIMNKTARNCTGDPQVTSDEQTESVLRPVSVRSSRGQRAQHLYTIAEVMRLASMSRRQVTYWSEIGLLSPALHPTRALKPAVYFAGTEVLKAMIICDLRRRGLTPKQVQQVANNLQDLNLTLSEDESYLLTDGYSVYYAFSNAEVVDVLKRHRQMLLVPVHEQIARMQEVA
jgi:DNA-binding transcriptional MerR regulator